MKTATITYEMVGKEIYALVQSGEKITSQKCEEKITITKLARCTQLRPKAVCNVLHDYNDIYIPCDKANIAKNVMYDSQN
jgi:hypothetical protein